MSNMRYCRHENTARDLAEVWDLWFEEDTEDLSSYEAQGRRNIVKLVREMYEQFESDGEYEG